MKGKKNPLIKKVIIASGIAALFAVLVTYIGLSMFFSEHYFYNTIINGEDYSYRTPIEAEEQYHNQLKLYALLITGRDNLDQVITSTDIQLQYETDGFFKSVKDNQRGFLWILGLFQNQSYELPCAFIYDEVALQEKINSLIFFREEQIKLPNEPHVQYMPESAAYMLISGSVGTELNRSRTDKRIKEAILALEEKISLEESSCYKWKPMEYEEKQLKLAMEEANRYLQASITYNWAGHEVLIDADTINEWIIFDQQIAQLDEEKVAEFIAQTAKKYDTFGKNRNFSTTDGRELTLKSGGYGWKADRTEELKVILETVKSGSEIMREPVYIYTANAGGENDIGTSYVEIDLGKQYLYLYVDGELLLESDLVSGNVSRGWTTPPGVFGLTYKTKNAVLRGETYETPVTYWMPFNGNIGMHDGYWRNAFGGDIYTTNGSHGCINLPPENAKFIYEYVYTGFPVICYY